MYLPNQIGDNFDSESILNHNVLGSQATQLKNLEFKPNEGFNLTFPKKIKVENLIFSGQIPEPQSIRPVSAENSIMIENVSQNGLQNKLNGTQIEHFQEVLDANSVHNQEERSLPSPNGLAKPATENNVFKDSKINGRRSVLAVNLQKVQEFQALSKIESKTSTSPVMKGVKNELNEQVVQVKEEPKEEESCRICLETEQNDEIGKLIVPCKCTGSMKWIHDECLKTWIISKGHDLQKATCELCNTNINSKFKYRLKFYPKVACEEGVVSLFTCICLSLVASGLVGVIVYFAVTWNKSSNSDMTDPAGSSYSLKLAIIVACSIIALILSVIIIITIRESFFVIEVAEWIILPLSNAQNAIVDEEWQDPEPIVGHRQSRHGERVSLTSLRTNIERNLREEQLQDNSFRIDFTHSNQGPSSNNNSVFAQNNANNLDESHHDLAQGNHRGSNDIMPWRRQSSDGIKLLKPSKTLEKRNEEELKSDNDENVQVLEKNISAISKRPESRSNDLPQEVLKTTPSAKSLLSYQKGKNGSERKIGLNADEKLDNLTKSKVIQGDSIVPIWQKLSSQESTKSLNVLRASKDSNISLSEKYGGAPLYQQIPKEFLNDGRANGEKRIEVLVSGSEKKRDFPKTSSDNNLLRQLSVLSNLSAKDVTSSKPKRLTKARSSLTIRSKYSKK